MQISAFNYALRGLVLAGQRGTSPHDEDPAQSRRSHNCVYGTGPFAEEIASSFKTHRRL